MRSQVVEFDLKKAVVLGLLVLSAGLVWSLLSPARAAGVEVNGIWTPMAPPARGAAIATAPVAPVAPTSQPSSAPVQLRPSSAPVASAPQTMQPIQDLGQDPGRKLNVVVLGDSLGDGLWAGLYRQLKSDGRFNVIKRSKVSTGFVRRDYFDWNAEVEAVLREEQVDIAVIMIGTNDRQVLVDDAGRRHSLRSAGWEAAYKDRVDRFTRALTDRGVLVYWVGLPIMRSPRFGRDMQYFNEIYAAQAVQNGVPFIPTWNELADANGVYTAYGPDTNGRRRLLRADDGIHFTLSGYRVLASVVADDLISDRDAGVMPGDARVAIEREPALPPSPTMEPIRSPSEARADGEPEPLIASSVEEIPTDNPELRPGRSDDWRWPRL